MPERDPHSAEADTESELQVRLYELLHDQARTERRWQFWRLAAGHLVVGTIIGYAFIFGQWRFVALTPILYGIVVLDGLKYTVRLLHLQQHLVAVEAKLSDREPLYEWVSEYGFFGGAQRIEVEDVDLNRVPELAQLLLIGSVYVALIVASLAVWTPLDSASTVTGFQITKGFLLLGYATFTLFFALVAFVGYTHYRDVQEDIEQTIGGKE